MAGFNPANYVELRAKFENEIRKSAEEQAEDFKLRYILTLREDVFLIDDQLRVYKNHLPLGDESFSYNDPKLTRFLEECKIEFDSFLTRNQEFNVLNPNNQRLSFIEFLLYVYRSMIVSDYMNRWKVDGRNLRDDLLAGAILSEFLDQPPYGVDPELDKLTKEVREIQANHELQVAKLRETVTKAEAKKVKSVIEKKAIAELAIIEQSDIEEKIRFTWTEITKRRNKVMIEQKEALRKIYEQADSPANPQGSIARRLPPGWFEYRDDTSGKPYYHNPGRNLTQWEWPVA